jgi:hypothetical protein
MQEAWETGLSLGNTSQAFTLGGTVEGNGALDPFGFSLFKSSGKLIIMFVFGLVSSFVELASGMVCKILHMTVLMDC